MTFFALVVGAQLAMAEPVLLLEKVRSVDDARRFEFNDDVSGDRGVPNSCTLAGGTTVKLEKTEDATLRIERNGVKKQIVVKNIKGVRRATLACGDGDGDDFYYANPRLGQVYAYSANRLFQGEDPVVWTRRLEPFKNADDANHVMEETSVATVVLVRQKLVMVEWFFRNNGKTGFWHQVFESATGETVGKLGPSDLLAKTNEHDPWWIFFEGGGNDTVNYVPRAIYRLRYGAPESGARPAAEVEEALRSQPGSVRVKAVAKLSPNRAVNHMIALLTPLRSATDSRIEFCPQWPADRAQYWLGEEYDPELGELARRMLLMYSADHQAPEGKGSALDAWFQTEIAPKEPMKMLLTHFSPQDDAWVAQYQQALLALGGPTLEDWFSKYGVGTGAVMRTPSHKAGP